MKTNPNGPADTTMMSVVHDALRRDLDRLRVSLAGSPEHSDAQRAALGDHVVWMMDFLHDHHHGEDAGLWPLVRDRNPDAAELLDRMNADHATIVPGIAAARRAGARYAADAGARDDLVESLAELSVPLLDHLRREEDEAMPVVSASITERDWKAWDQRHNVRGKSLSRLAAEGHWLMDGLDPDRYDVLVHLVPAPVRVVVIKGYAGRYRRACALRWGTTVDVRPLAEQVRSPS